EDEVQVRAREGTRFVIPDGGEALLHRRDVRVLDVDAFYVAGAFCSEVALRDAFLELLDVAAEKARLAAHDLEAVLVTGVVASCDHHAAVRVEVMNSEVQHRRRANADVLHVNPSLGESRDECLEKTRARETTIACNGESRGL